MAQHFSDQELKKFALKIIEEKQCETIGDLIYYMPIGRSCFYLRGLDKVDSIKDAIVDIQYKEKREIRKRWKKSGNAALETCVYKILADEDELRRLQSHQKQDPAVEKGEKLTIKREVISKKE